MSAERIAVIGGTGDLGLGLALRWAAAGVPIVIGSRDTARALQAADNIRKAVQAAGQRPASAASVSAAVEGLTNAEAAARATVVVLAVPFTAQAATLREIRGSLAEGSFLVDTTVPLAATVGGKPTRLLGVWQGSAAEQAREIIPAAVPVLAAFHNVSADALQDLAHPPDCDVLVCGDDAAAKERLSPLIHLIPGLHAVDAGALELARIVESLTALLISINRRYKVPHAGLRLTGLTMD